MRIDNRMQRAQLRARKNAFGGDSQISVDDQLTRLEDDIRQANHLLEERVRRRTAELMDDVHDFALAPAQGGGFRHCLNF